MQAPAVSAADFNFAEQTQFFDGLRDRQLHELIEQLCQQQLATELTADERLFYQLELAQAYALHAQLVSLDQAEELWQAAHETLDGVDESNGLERRQRALINSARVKQLFWIVRADPTNVPVRQQFEQQVARSLASLKADFSVSDSFCANCLDTLDASAFNFDELTIAHASVLLQRAEIIVDNPAQRAAWIRDAEKLLAPFLKKTLKERWELEAELLQLTVSRLRGDEAELNEGLKFFEQAEVPAEMKFRAVAEQVRLLLASDRANADSDAAQAVLDLGQELGYLPAELEALRLRALLNMARDVRELNNTRLADSLEQEVEQRLMVLESRGEQFHVWGVRNYQQRLAMRSQLGGELARLIEAARTARQQGAFAEALAHYEAALAEVRDTNRLEVGVEIAAESAGLAFELGQFAEAAAFLKTLWQSSPNFEQMETVHLLWIQALGRNYMAGRTADKLADYMNGLNDHRKRYADRPTAHEATWLLAELQFARLQVTQALQLYQEIPDSSPRATTALLRIGQCYQWITERVRSLGQPTGAWEAGAAQFADDVLQSLAGKPIQNLAQAELLLFNCRVLLADGSLRGEALLAQSQRLTDAAQAALQAEPLSDSLSQKWRMIEMSGLALAGVAWAQRGQLDQAQQMLLDNTAIQSTAVDALLFARQLSQIDVTDTQSQTTLAQLCVQVTDGLYERFTNTTDLLDAEQTADLLTVRAEAFLRLGRITPAMELYEQLRERQPRQYEYVRRLSELYDECQNDACAEKSYQMWQQWTGSQKQGTEPWLRARYEVARLAVRTGRIDEAKKLVQLTELLYPELGSDELRQQFATLSQQINTSN